MVKNRPLRFALRVSPLGTAPPTKTALLALLWTLLGMACGTESEPETTAALPVSPPVRASVVSLSPSASRFVIALGGRDLLVGVDLQSSALPGLEALPVVNLETAGRLGAELVLVPRQDAHDDAAAPRAVPTQTEYVDFAPHDLEEVVDLARTLGERLVGRAQAVRFERELLRPLAAVGAASFGQERPRIAAVLGLEPPELAGGHSFATDLIEIAGGTSVTHGGEESSFAVGEADWARLAPDLIVVVSSQPMSEEERSRARAILPAAYPLIFFSFDPDTFWLEEPADTARQLRKLLLESQGRDS